MKKRKKKVRITGKRDILTVTGKEDGYFYCWVNDVGTQINRYKEGGYEAVEDNGCITVGTTTPTQVGGAITATVDKRTGEKAVLMRIREDWHKEDLASEQDTLQKDEKSLLRQQQEENGRYGKVEVS